MRPLPLVLPVMGAQGLARGAHVRVKLGDIDFLTLDVGGTVVERLDVPLDAEVDEESGDEDEALSAGPIAIAVDVNETEAADGASATPAAPAAPAAPEMAASAQEQT